MLSFSAGACGVSRRRDRVDPGALAEKAATFKPVPSNRCRAEVQAGGDAGTLSHRFFDAGNASRNAEVANRYVRRAARAVAWQRVTDAAEASGLLRDLRVLAVLPSRCRPCISPSSACCSAPSRSGPPIRALNTRFPSQSASAAGSGSWRSPLRRTTAFRPSGSAGADLRLVQTSSRAQPNRAVRPDDGLG